MSFDNPFDDLDNAEQEAKQERKQKRKSSRKAPTFDNALSTTSRVDAARAAKKSTVQGKYWLRTLRLPPEYQELTRQIYLQEPRARSIAEIERWIYTMGLKAYLEENKRPDYNDSIQRDIQLPNIGDSNT